MSISCLYIFCIYVYILSIYILSICLHKQSICIYTSFFKFHIHCLYSVYIQFHIHCIYTYRHVYVDGTKTCLYGVYMTYRQFQLTCLYSTSFIQTKKRLYHIDIQTHDPEYYYSLLTKILDIVLSQSTSTCSTFEKIFHYSTALDTRLNHLPSTLTS